MRASFEHPVHEFGARQRRIGNYVVWRSGLPSDRLVTRTAEGCDERIEEQGDEIRHGSGAGFDPWRRQIARRTGSSTAVARS
jgi:hypothetical protein